MLDRMQRLRRGAVTTVGTAIMLVVLASCGGTGPDNGQNSLHPSGPDARQILDLMNPFFWVAVVIGAAVIAMTFYVALRFRERPGDDRSPVQTHGNIVLEVSWTIIPFLILAVMSVPTVATIFDLAKIPKGENVIHVTVDARQWFWQYKYTDAGAQFYTANEMHIPVDQPVVLKLTSANVIHSFWVPQLAGKKDVVPGHDNTLVIEADREGTFLGQCAEYCGLSHANMRLRVVAESKAEYAQWVREQQAPLSGDNVAKWEKLAKPWGCTTCHSITSTEKTIGATTGPNLTHLGDRQTFAGDIYPMKLDDLTKWIHNAPGRKPAGPIKGWMPAFDKSGMTIGQAQELAKFLLCDTATNPTPECRT